ncbi:GGDEF domain-containing protein [Halanaerobium sp. ST460_2HS_T2]|uniref:GGDEF domain-containing protein n=1 Tax=Halanaerobium sp. ST460_2HS_T2 TaxID=2183914 RepID=UPI000DF43374|nr:GGDEF domain-containing protein [Halanaerobium sp. ST460_2HS_T2]
MDLKTNKNQIINILTYLFLFMIVLILISKFNAGGINDRIDYLFAFSYFLIFFIIYDNFLKNTDDLKNLLIWLLQILLYVIFLFLEYYTVIKFFILFQVLFGVISSGKQIQTFKKQNKKIRYLSFHDEMTGLYNRRYFENKLEDLNNPAKHNLSVIIADINNLKVINDNHGHKKGDQYIKSAAGLLKSELRQKDIICRIGGDEFAIILPDTYKNDCKRIIKRIKTKVKRHPEKFFSIAFGHIYESHKYDTLEEMINAADRKMYHNKKKIKKRLNLDLERKEIWE